LVPETVPVPGLPLSVAVLAGTSGACSDGLRTAAVGTTSLSAWASSFHSARS